MGGKHDDVAKHLEEEFVYYSSSNVWELRQYRDEWYHLKTGVDLETPEKTPAAISIFPNPCKVGQNLTIKYSLKEPANPEVLIFDMHGRMITKMVPGSSLSFQAPRAPGAYNMVVRRHEQLMGIVTQIVVD